MLSSSKKLPILKQETGTFFHLADSYMAGHGIANVLKRVQYLQLARNRCRRMKQLNLEKYEQIGKLHLIFYVAVI